MDTWMIVLTAVATVPLLYYIWMTFGLLLLRLEVDMNDSRVAAEAFIELLRDAKRTMLICDDGNDMPDSIYNADDVIEATRTALAANPDLQLQCLFSSDDETRFSRAFAREPRVIIKRQGPRRDVHFRIIDGGQKGYVSAHAFGSGMRRYRKYDCSRRLIPGHVREAALGRHVRSIQGLFPKVIPEAAR